MTNLALFSQKGQNGCPSLKKGQKGPLLEGGVPPPIDHFLTADYAKPMGSTRGTFGGGPFLAKMTPFWTPSGGGHFWPFLALFGPFGATHGISRQDAKMVQIGSKSSLVCPQNGQVCKSKVSDPFPQVAKMDLSRSFLYAK